MLWKCCSYKNSIVLNWKHHRLIWAIHEYPFWFCIILKFCIILRFVNRSCVVILILEQTFRCWSCLSLEAELMMSSIFWGIKRTFQISAWSSVESCKNLINVNNFSKWIFLIDWIIGLGFLMFIVLTSTNI